MRAMALIMFTLFIAITASPVVAQPKVSQVRPTRIYKASTGPLKTPAGSGTKASPSQSRGGRWTHALFEKVRGEVQRSAHALLHDRHDAPLVLPLEVNIVLVGFDGDGGYRYRADAKALETFLRQSFGHFRPSSMSTGRPLEVSIELHYNVVHAGTDHLRTIESAISHSAEPADDEPPPHPWGDVSSTNDNSNNNNNNKNKRWRAYEVEAAGPVENAVDFVYRKIFASLNPTVRNLEPVAVFVVNPDKCRMDPGKDHDALDWRDARGISQAPPETLSPPELLAEECGYAYRYRYMDGEGAAAAWVGAGRYAVLDLGAGPAALTRVGRGVGGAENGSGRSTGATGLFQRRDGTDWGDAATTTETSLPRLGPLLLPYARYLEENGEDEATRADLATRRDAHMRGRLSTLVLSSVRHLLAPDVAAETLDFAERVMIPVVVLRDHNSFWPLDLESAGPFRHLDVELVKEEAKKMLQPGQEIVLMTGTHNLHEHKRLTAAVLRSLRTSSRADRRNAGIGPGHEHTYHVTARRYLDGATLLEEFRRSADLLASGLVGLEDPDLDAAFYAQANRLADSTEEDDELAGTRPDGGTNPNPSSSAARGSSRCTSSPSRAYPPASSSTASPWWPPRTIWSSCCRASAIPSWRHRAPSSAGRGRGTWTPNPRRRPRSSRRLRSSSRCTPRATRRTRASRLRRRRRRPRWRSSAPAAGSGFPSVSRPTTGWFTRGRENRRDTSSPASREPSAASRPRPSAGPRYTAARWRTGCGRWATTRLARSRGVRR